jgi:hypothetical protein
MFWLAFIGAVLLTAAGSYFAFGVEGAGGALAVIATIALARWIYRTS